MSIARGILILSFVIILLLIILSISKSFVYYAFLSNECKDAPIPKFSSMNDKRGSTNLLKNNSVISLDHLTISNLTLVNSTIEFYWRLVLKGRVKLINCYITSGRGWIYLKSHGLFTFINTTIDLGSGTIKISNSSLYAKRSSLPSRIIVINSSFTGEDVFFDNARIYMHGNNNLSVSYIGDATFSIIRSYVEGNITSFGNIVLDLTNDSSAHLHVDLIDNDYLMILSKDSIDAVISINGNADSIYIDILNLKNLEIEGSNAKVNNLIVRNLVVEHYNLKLNSTYPIHIINNSSLSLKDETVNSIIILNGSLTLYNTTASSVYLYGGEVVSIDRSNVSYVTIHNISSITINNSEVYSIVIENTYDVNLTNSIIQSLVCKNCENLFLENITLYKSDTGGSIGLAKILEKYGYLRPNSIIVENIRGATFISLYDIKDLMLKNITTFQSSYLTGGSYERRYLSIINVSRAVFDKMVQNEEKLYFLAIGAKSLVINNSMFRFSLYKIINSSIEFYKSEVIFEGIYRGGESPFISVWRGVEFRNVSLKFEECNLRNIIINGDFTIEEDDTSSYIIINSKAKVYGNRDALILLNSDLFISGELLFIGSINSNIVLNDSFIRLIEINNTTIKGFNVDVHKIRGTFNNISIENNGLGDQAGVDFVFYQFRFSEVSIKIFNAEFAYFGIYTYQASNLNIALKIFDAKEVDCSLDIWSSENVNLLVESQSKSLFDMSISDVYDSKAVSLSLNVSSKRVQMFLGIDNSEKIKLSSFISSDIYCNSYSIYNSKNVYINPLRTYSITLKKSSNVFLGGIIGDTLNIRESKNVTIKDSKVRSLSIIRVEKIIIRNLTVDEELNLYLTKDELSSADLSGLNNVKLQMVVSEDEKFVELSDNDLLYALNVKKLKVSGNARFVILVNSTYTKVDSLRAQYLRSFNGELVIKNSKINITSISNGIIKISDSAIKKLSSYGNITITESRINQMFLKGGLILINASKIGPKRLYIRNSFNVTIINSDLSGEVGHAGIIIEDVKYLRVIGNYIHNTGQGWAEDGYRSYWGCIPADTGGIVLIDVDHALIMRNDFSNNFMDICMMGVEEVYIYLNNFWDNPPSWSPYKNIFSCTKINLNYTNYGNYWRMRSVNNEPYILIKNKVVDYHPLPKPVRTRMLKDKLSQINWNLISLLLIVELILAYKTSRLYSKIAKNES